MGCPEEWSVRSVRSGWKGREGASANGLVLSEGNGRGEGGVEGKGSAWDRDRIG